MNKIFVYGSLKKGQYNHELLEDADYIGPAVAHGLMFSLGQYPAVIPDSTNLIHGEVYNVTDAELKLLDQLEGHPHIYRRTPITLLDGRQAEIYFFTNAERLVKYQPWIESGNWNENDS